MEVWARQDGLGARLRSSGGREERQRRQDWRPLAARLLQSRAPAGTPDRDCLLAPQPRSPSLGRAAPLGSTRSMPLCTKGSTSGGGAPEAAAAATSQPTPFLQGE